MTTIEPVHDDHVGEQQNQEPDDGSLLGHPESKRCMPYVGQRGIEEISKQNSAPERDKCPDAEDDVDEVKTSLPVAVFLGTGRLFGRIHGSESGR